MGPDGAGEELGVELSGRQVEAAGEGGLAVALDFGLDHGESCEVREAGLSGEAAFGCEPADLARDAMAAGLDPAVVAVDGLVRVEGRCGRGLEDEADLLGEGRPIVLEGQEIIGSLGPDGPGDAALAADGVDGDEPTGEFEPPGGAGWR